MAFVRSSLCLAALCVLASSPALAQFRPPPMSPAQRLVLAADADREESTKLRSAGEKKAATEKLQEAAKKYAEALESDPESLAAAVGLAQVQASLEQWDALVKAVRPIADRNPTDMDLAFGVGQALLKLNKLNEAKPYFERVGASTRKDLCLVHYYLGWMALNAGDAKGASSELSRYLAERPPELAAADPQIQELLGRAWLLQSDAPNARAAFQAALTGAPGSLYAQMGLEAVLELEGKRAEAIDLLQGLIVRHPKAAEPKERLAWLLLGEGRTKEAETLALQLSAHRQNARTRLLLGNVRLAQGSLTEAEGILRQALAEMPDLTAASTALAQAIQRQGRHADAIAVLQNALAKRPNDFSVLAALGSAQRRAGKPAEALETHRKMTAAKPDDVRANLLVGADEFALGRWDAAIAAYDAVLRKDATHSRAKHWAAQALIHRAKVSSAAGKSASAVDDLKRAYELAPVRATARALGAAQLANGNPADALLVLASAAGAPDAEFEDHLLLGYAQYAGGDVETAAKTFDQAMKLAVKQEQKAQGEAASALVDLKLGRLDAAVSKLSNADPSGPNLPLALLQRAVRRVREGEQQPAEKDLEIAEKLLKKDPAQRHKEIAELARAMVRVEDGRYGDAQAAFNRALAGQDSATHRLLAGAYVEYRQNKAPQARKLLAQAQKLGPSPAVAALSEALARRELELSYRKGDLRGADRALKELGQSTGAVVAHNRACVDYRKGKVKAALEAWEKTAANLPESSLNLAMHAHLKEKDAALAISWYDRYLSARSGHSSVRQLKERLEMIHGLGVAEGGAK